MKFFLMFLCACLPVLSVYAQDTLVKTDHSKLAVKVIEVNPETVKYKRFDYPDGPLMILDKKEVSAIVYQNGLREMFEPVSVATLTPPTPDTLIVSPLYALREEQAQPKLRIYFHVAAVINGSYSNKPYKDSPENVGHGGSPDSYSKPGKEYYNTGLSVGVTLLSGRNEYFKTLLGIHYVQSKAEFNRNVSSIDRERSSPYGTYSTNTQLNYKNTSHFINLVAGIRFKIFKGLSMEPCLSLNINAYSTSKVNGTITSNNGPNPDTQHLVKDSTSGFTDAHVTVSFIPRLVYEFKIKEQTVGVYASYNMALRYRLPWLMFGVTWYPFKKLR
jgi:hypothetical protein